MSDDDRVKCTDCTAMRGIWCHNATKAGMHAISGKAEISRTLAKMPQRCPAFVAKLVAK